MMLVDRGVTDVASFLLVVEMAATDRRGINWLAGFAVITPSQLPGLSSSG